MRSLFRSSFSRRFFSAVLVLLSFVAVLTFSACTGATSFSRSGSGAAGSLPTECRIGYQVIPNNEVLAKSLRLFEKQFPEVKIKWRPFPAGWRVNAAMAAGELDIGLVGSLPVSTGVAQGLPLQVFVIHNLIGDNAALAVTEASGIGSIADLPGKSIGVPFGSTSHYSLLTALEQNNIDPTAVNILDMSISDLIARWNINRIDGAFVWQPTLAKLLKVNGTVVLTAKQLIEKGAVTADLGTVSNEFAAAYPDFLAGFVAVLDEATQFYRDNPSAAAAAIADEVNLSAEVSLAIMNELIWLGAAEQSDPQYMGTVEAPGAIAQVLKDSAEFMEAQKAIPPAPELETFQQALFHQ